jgi:hypothetical protein
VLAKALFLRYTIDLLTRSFMQTPTQTPIPSSTGGTIVHTKTGLIHYAGTAYSGKIAAQEAKEVPAGK